MDVVPPVVVKVCGIRSPAEAALALQFGASAIGLVSDVPSGQAEISLDAARAVVASVPESVGTFLVTSATDVGLLYEKQRHTGANTIQLWDRLGVGDYERLRRLLPEISLVQAVHVHGEDAIDEALEVSRWVDAILLDSGSSTVPYRWVDASSETHDWTISRRVVERLDTPVFLSGGLTSRNLTRAIRLVRPYGVDVLTGVRTADGLDKPRLVEFFETLMRVPT